ncbi:hypothetical protein ALC62_02405 [Cyphomyrmex costatus]|uniref:Uncharacterized protein n=1 Tax=Cyphomyrmex costatus TaxID=456900 RepID=A0A195D1M5_9HYME|nr:hypothetical protein ALC62_02405 [Cyphomyrmex costatus]
MPLLLECNLVCTEYTTRYTAVRSVAPSAVQYSAAHPVGSLHCTSRPVKSRTLREFCEVVAVNRVKVNFRRWDVQNSVAGWQFRRYNDDASSFSPREIESSAREIEEKINNSNDDERWEASSIWTVINAGGDRDSEGGTKRKTTDAGCSLKRHIASSRIALRYDSPCCGINAPPTGSALCY